MTDSNKTEERDEVLFAFHQECTRPTSAHIIAWTRRFPQYAEDIRAHAAVAWDWAAAESQQADELDESLAARGYSQALNIIFSAEHQAVASNSAARSQSFQEIMRGTGKEVYQLARELDIDRGILADLFNGWMSRPICKPLVDRVISSLSISIEAFNSAVESALQRPYLGHAKADKTPTIRPRSCAEIIRDSNMSAERKRFWLGEDQ